MSNQSAGNTTRSSRKERSAARASNVREEFLYFIIDCERPLRGGARYVLRGVQRAFFGRTHGRGISRDERGSQLTLDMDNDIVSRSHAGITRSPSGWLIEDFGSKHGTFINGRRVAGASPVAMNDIIQIGGPIGGLFFMIGQAMVRAGAEAPIDITNSHDADEHSLPGFPTLMPALAAELASLIPAVRSDAPLVIIGETGTGKELLARGIHNASGRKGAFIPLNCAGLTADLVEAQLFGYVKGAYSGAGVGNPGFIRAADGGTLFLDEIMDLPLADQAKLLRVLQEREVIPLGTSKALRVDVRFVAASQKHLGDLVAMGRFRDDLRNRLERRVAEVSPLRERRPDIGLLSAALLKRHGVREKDNVVLPSTAVARMLAYRWPGNVRELENKLGESVDRIADGVLDADVFPKAEDDQDPSTPGVPDVFTAKGKQARDVLEELLKKHGGNVSAVARDLKKHREPVYRLLERVGLDHKIYRRS